MIIAAVRIVFCQVARLRFVISSFTANKQQCGKPTMQAISHMVFKKQVVDYCKHLAYFSTLYAMICDEQQLLHPFPKSIF